MKAVNIEWDVDCQEELEDLPTEIEIPEGMEDMEDISDYLSDVTGFCHKGYDLIDSQAYLVYDSTILKISNGISSITHSNQDFDILDYAKIGGCSFDELVAIEKAIDRTQYFDSMKKDPFSEETLLKIANGIGNTIHSDEDLGILEYARLGGCSVDELSAINYAIKQASHYMPDVDRKTPLDFQIQSVATRVAQVTSKSQARIPNWEPEI